MTKSRKSIERLVEKELAQSRIKLIRAMDKFTVICADKEKAMDKAEALYWNENEERDIYIRYLDEDTGDWEEELFFEAA